MRLAPQIREPGRRADIATDRPRLHLALVLGAEQEVVQELGALLVGGIPENGSALGPAHVVALGRVREVKCGRDEAAAAGAEKGGLGLGAVGGDEGRRRGAADPARVLLQKTIEPRRAVFGEADGRTISD